MQAPRDDISQGNAVWVPVHWKDGSRGWHGARFPHGCAIHIPRSVEAGKRPRKSELRPCHLLNHQKTDVQGRASGLGNTGYVRTNCCFFKTVTTWNMSHRLLKLLTLSPHPRPFCCSSGIYIEHQTALLSIYRL